MKEVIRQRPQEFMAPQGRGGSGGRFDHSGPQRLTKKQQWEENRARKAEEKAELTKKGEQRRMLLIGGGIGGGILLIGGIGKGIEYLLQENDEAKTDRVVGLLDKGLDRVRPQLEEKLKDFPPPIQEFMLAPIKTHDANRSNPNRNYLRFARNTKTIDPFQSREAQPDYFFFQVSDMQENKAGSYNPFLRTVILKRDMQDNLVDLSMAYHELEHVHQDNQEWKGFSTEMGKRGYLGFIDSSSRILIDNEIIAHHKQAVFVNLMTNGAFEKAIKEGKREVDYYMNLLQASEGQRSAVESLINLGNLTFTPDFRVGLTSANFAEAVIKLYKDKELLRKSPTGGLVRVAA